MDNFEIKNIMQTLMYELDIDTCFWRQVKGLVANHWSWHGVIYRYLCNICKRSKVVDENQQFYIVHRNVEQCRSLMHKVEQTN